MKNLVFLLPFLIFWQSCGVLLEDDLSEEKVTIISPSNQYNTVNQSIEFRWDSMSYARNYHFQLVVDSFGGNGNWILDTILDTTRLRLSLQPNTYAWRVMGKNTNSTSDYNDYFFTVVTDTSLNNQVITTIYPTANFAHVADSVAIWWYPINISLGVSYEILIANHPSFNSQSLAQQVFTANDNYTFVNTLSFGTFYWKMRALRPNIDTTAFTQVLSFTIDVVPNLVQPNNNSSITLPYLFNWNSAISAQRDTIYVFYENEALPYKVAATNSRSYSFNSNDTIGKGEGNYYWRVRSVGNNNNNSSYSELRKFIIQ